MRNRIALLALALLCLMPACDDSDIALITDKLDEATIASDTARITILEMEEQAFISTELALDLVRGISEFDVATLETIRTVREIHQLDQPQREQILKILQPVLGALGEVVDKTTLIENEQAKLAIRTSLLAVQTVLENVQAVIHSRGES